MSQTGVQEGPVPREGAHQPASLPAPAVQFMDRKVASEGSPAGDALRKGLASVGINKKNVRAVLLQGMATVEQFRAKQQARSESSKAAGTKSKTPDWNASIDPDKSAAARLRRVDRRPFIVMSLLFFGCFSWFYILYQVHARDAERTHTPGVFDLGAAVRKQPASAESAAPDNVAGASAPAAAGVSNQNPFGAPRTAFPGAASPPYTPAVGNYGSVPTYAPPAGNYGGAPANTPSAASYGTPGFTQAVGQAASQSVQSQYATAASAAANPYGYNQAQALTPAGFNTNDALIAPRSMRHSIGMPMMAAPLPNGRQRVVVNR